MCTRPDLRLILNRHIYIYIYIMGSALCRRPLLDVDCSLKSFDFLCVFAFSLRSAMNTQLEGGNYGICSPWCGCLKGRHYCVLGSGFGSQYLCSGDPGGSFWYLWAHFGDRGCPGGSKRHPLESEEVFNQFLTDFGSLFGTTLGSFL